MTTVDFYELLGYSVQLHYEETWIDLYLEIEVHCSHYILCFLCGTISYTSYTGQSFNNYTLTILMTIDSSGMFSYCVDIIYY